MSAVGPSARKSLRINTQGTKNENPHASKEKHWVVAACKDRVTQKNVKDWVTLRRTWGKDYEQLDLNKSGFKNVDPKEKLYIHCHGGYPEGGDTQALWIGEGDGKSVTANQFANYLKNNHLNNQHEVLKIAACHSDEFAKELHEELKNEYPKLTVYGYMGQFKACYGNRGGNLAGLEEPYIKEDEKGRWVIDDAKIRDKEVTERFRAKNNRVSFGPKAEEEIKDKKDNAQSKSSSPISSLSSLSRPLVPTIAQPPARSSLSASSQSSSSRSPAEFAAMREREALAASEVIRVMQERSQQERQQRRSQRIARQNQENHARPSRQSDSPKQNSNESSPSRSPRPSPNK